MTIALILALNYLANGNDNFDYYDVADTLASQVASDMGVTLGSRRSADWTFENDWETVILSIESDWFDNADNYDGWDTADFLEVLQNTCRYGFSIESIYADSPAAENLENEFKDMLHKERELAEYFEDGEDIDIKAECYKLKHDKDKITYYFTVTIE